MFIGRQYENFYIICLDSQNRINHSALVHEGTLSEVPVYPRIIVELALRHQAHSIILAHNHPGGSLNASQEDMTEAARERGCEPGSIDLQGIEYPQDFEW